MTSAVVRASRAKARCSAAVGSEGTSTRLNSHGGVIQHGAVAALVIIDETLANFPNSLLDA